MVEEIYRLFDRRCRTETALAKLARLRAHVRRFKGLGPIFQKLQSPNLEKALTFLDDSLLGSTSNAVERGNRRHRKMQKTVYRVRTQPTISGRIALDIYKSSKNRDPLTRWPSIRQAACTRRAVDSFPHGRGQANSLQVG